MKTEPLTVSAADAGNPRPIRRLFVAQGPTQLLNGDAVAQYLDKPDTAPAENSAMLFGRYAFRKDARIREATKLVAKSSTWSQVYDLFDLEDAMWENPEPDIRQLVAEIRRVTGGAFDELHVVRNWQVSNEIVIKAHENARLFCYGDGFGRLDSVALPGFRIPEAAFGIIPDIVSVVAEAVTPELIPFHIVPPEFLVAAVNRVRVELKDGEGLGHLGASGRTALLLASNYADGGFLTLEEEIVAAARLANVMLADAEEIVVKSHPREIGGQAAAIADRLVREFGRNARTLGSAHGEERLEGVPIEILAPAKVFHRIASPFASYAAVTVPWLFKATVEIPSAEAISTLSFLSEKKREFLIRGIESTNQLSQKLSAWDGKSILLRERVSNPEAYEHFRNPKTKQRWLKEIRSVRQALLRRDQPTADVAASLTVPGNEIEVARQKEHLSLYWDEDMAKLLETWGEGNAWHEVKFLMSGLNGKVLDIACGTGKTIDLLGEIPGLDLHGFDISDLLIEKAVDRGIDRSKLTICDATATPYANDQFDYSFSIGSLEHFKDGEAEKFLAEAARITRVGSFHQIPTARNGLDNGWVTPYQSYYNNSIDWWRRKMVVHFSRVVVLDSLWEDPNSVGKWFLCYK